MSSAQLSSTKKKVFNLDSKLSSVKHNSKPLILMTVGGIESAIILILPRQNQKEAKWEVYLGLL